MSNNKVLCTCYKCKTKNNAGYYVNPSTRWRHIKKEQSNYNILNDHDSYETNNRLVFINLSIIQLIQLLIKLAFFITVMKIFHEV
jgi:hypothetical protein